MTVDMEVGGELVARLTNTLDRVDRRLAVWDRMQAYTPVDYQTQAGAAYPSGAAAMVLNLGSPDQGTYWQVQQCIIGGAEVTTAAAGSAGLYVTGLGPTTGSAAIAVGAVGGLTSAADFTTSLPKNGFYSTRQLIVNGSEYLIVLIYGGTANQLYAAAASVTVFATRAARGEVETTA